MQNKRKRWLIAAAGPGKRPVDLHCTFHACEEGRNLAKALRIPPQMQRQSIKFGTVIIDNAINSACEKCTSPTKALRISMFTKRLIK